VTVTVVVPVQPAALVPVTVYVVVAAGLAETDAPVVAESPVDGVQVYVEAPLAVKVTAGDPAHLVAGGTVITGFGFTVTVTVVVPEQPVDVVPVTV